MQFFLNFTSLPRKYRFLVLLFKPDISSIGHRYTSQRGCGISTLENTQKPSGHGLGQCVLDDPA